MNEPVLRLVSDVYLLSTSEDYIPCTDESIQWVDAWGSIVAEKSASSRM